MIMKSVKYWLPLLRCRGQGLFRKSVEFPLFFVCLGGRVVSEPIKYFTTCILPPREGAVFFGDGGKGGQ